MLSVIALASIAAPHAVVQTHFNGAAVIEAKGIECDACKIAVPKIQDWLKNDEVGRSTSSSPWHTIRNTLL